MAVLSSTVQPASDSFKENRSSMFELIDHWRSLEQRTIDASNKRLKTFRSRGQLSPRERLERLLDPGMPFLQMHSMANYCVENPDRETSVPGASVIVGVGFVEGVRCMIWVDDSGISAGAATESTGFVSTSILEMCMRQKLPVIHLVESAGANLLKYKVELWSRFGNVFRDLARLSAAGIPTMVVLHGGSTAGGAYMPGMSDYVIGVKENGMAALGGAALVKAATGEEADDRELGGTEMHSSVSGVVEYLVEDDAHGILKAREVMKSIDWNKRVTRVVRRPYEPPRFPVEELAGAIRSIQKCRTTSAKCWRGLSMIPRSKSSSHATVSRPSAAMHPSRASVLASLVTTAPLIPMVPRRRRSLFSSVMLQICPSCFSTTPPDTWWAQSTSKRA